MRRVRPGSLPNVEPPPSSMKRLSARTWPAPNRCRAASGEQRLDGAKPTGFALSAHNLENSARRVKSNTPARVGDSPVANGLVDGP